MDPSPEDSADEEHSTDGEGESADASPEAFPGAGHDLSAVARAAMGTPSMAQALRGVTGMSAALDTIRVNGVLSNARIASNFTGALDALRANGALDTIKATSVYDAAHLTAGMGPALDAIKANGVLNNARIASNFTGALDALRANGAYGAARLTVGNIDFGGYDAAAAATAAAGVSSVFDSVRLAVASSEATDVLRFLSGSTDVLSPLAEVARAAGQLNFGRLFHDLQLPDPEQFDPPNWPAELDIDVVTEILNKDGIPLVWVPRQEIVELLVEAPDRSSRIAILLSRVDDLVEDCHRVLADITDPTLLEQLPLAIASIEAFAAGHRESAHALATAVTDTLIKRAVKGDYKTVAKKVFFNHDAVPWHRLRLTASLAPIGPFFTTWYPGRGTPAPEALSRHVSLHQATTSHYSPGNATVAVLLATSILRGVQELQGGTFVEAA